MRSESIRMGDYHTVNTGKYTMVPYLGYRLAERILGVFYDKTMGNVDN